MTRRTRRPSNYQLHFGLLTGAVLIVFVVLSMVLLGSIRLLGVFDWHSAWLTAAVIMIFAVLYVVLKIVLRLTALTCERCGKRTMEARLNHYYRTRHECRNCGLALVAGKVKIPGDA